LRTGLGRLEVINVSPHNAVVQYEDAAESKLIEVVKIILNSRPLIQLTDENRQNN
jgi:hypothetical protein